MAYYAVNVDEPMPTIYALVKYVLYVRQANVNLLAVVDANERTFL